MTHTITYDAEERWLVATEDVDHGASSIIARDVDPAFVPRLLGIPSPLQQVVNAVRQAYPSEPMTVTVDLEGTPTLVGWEK